MPKFSVVIPLYNKVGQVENTLRSVFDQTFTDYEIVIVDDGSTDGSAELVERIIKEGLLDSTFHILHSTLIRLIRQPNSGVSAARNRGIAEAKGEYIALLDADDEWKHDYLATQADLIKRYPEAEVFATNYEFRNERGETKPTILRSNKFDGSDGILDNYFEVASNSHPPLWTSAVVVSKKAYQSCVGFPVGIKSGEDLLTWARLACKYKIAYTLSPKSSFLVDDNSQNQDQKDRKPEEIDYVGNELKKLYLENKSVKGLRQYVSLWHKMRCRIFISKKDKKNAFKESRFALKYDVNKKNCVFLILSLLPTSLSNKIIGKFS